MIARANRVCRRRNRGAALPEGAIYVGRPTMWGNPFMGRRWGHAKGVLLRRRWLRPVPDFDADTELDAIADSLDRVSIAMEAEETFGIDLPTVEHNRWRTVGDVEASLRAHSRTEA